MRKTSVQWTLAIILTLVAAVYQRMTGPTYPVRGHVVLGGEDYTLRLTRSHALGDQPVRLEIKDQGVTGEVKWRRFPTADSYQTVPLVRKGDFLEAALPHQLPAGKLEYQVRLTRGEERVLFPAQPAVTRFKNEESPYVLIPHVFAMFVGMLMSTKAGLAAIAGTDTRKNTFWACAFLLIGGFVLGPIMQRQAFGAYWTGVPFGFDLTDNKTLIAALAWGLAAFMMRGGKQARFWVVLAALVMLAVFSIPHSVWGSQVNWGQLPVGR